VTRPSCIAAPDSDPRRNGWPDRAGLCADRARPSRPIRRPAPGEEQDLAARAEAKRRANRRLRLVSRSGALRSTRRDLAALLAAEALPAGARTRHRVGSVRSVHGLNRRGTRRPSKRWLVRGAYFLASTVALAFAPERSHHRRRVGPDPHRRSSDRAGHSTHRHPSAHRPLFTQGERRRPINRGRRGCGALRPRHQRRFVAGTCAGRLATARCPRSGSESCSAVSTPAA
jgi:hypothetical protein